MKPTIKIILSLFFAGNFFPAIGQSNRDDIKTTLLILIDAEKFEVANRSDAIDEAAKWQSYFPSAKQERLWIEEASFGQSRERMSYDGKGLGGFNYFFYTDSTSNLIRLNYANPLTNYEIARFRIPLARSRNNKWEVKKIYLVSPDMDDNNLSNEYAIIHYVYDSGPKGEVYKTLLISCLGQWIPTGGYTCKPTFKHDFPIQTNIHPFTFIDINSDGYIDFIHLDWSQKIPKIQVFDGDKDGRFTQNNHYRIDLSLPYPFWVVHTGQGAILCKVVIV